MNSSKKFLLVLVVLLLAGNIYAQSSETSSSSQDDSFFYINVSVVTVFDHKDAYIVDYAKGSLGTGEIYLPKKWFKTSSADKCRVRDLSKGSSPYMTVIYKNDQLQKVYLNMPKNRQDSTWKILSTNVDISDKLPEDISQLKIEY